MEKYHSWIPLLSYDAVLYMAEGARNAGKSYPMLLRAMCRLKRHKRALVWLRRTEVEAKDWLASFGSAKWEKIARQAGLDPEKMERRGGVILYDFGQGKNHDKRKLLRVGSLSEWSRFRDTDDTAEELIYLDEAFSTVEAHRRYQGNEVEHGLDILKSLRRGGNDLRMLIAGNAERPVNPWADYFNVTRPKKDGITLLTPENHGAFGIIPYERIPQRDSDKLDAYNKLVSGTAIGDFLAGAAKGENARMIRAVSKRAKLYANVDFGKRLSLWLDGDMIIVSMRRADGRVLRIHPDGRTESVLLTPDVKKRFSLLRSAWRAGRVRFDTAEAMEWGISAISKLL